MVNGLTDGSTVYYEVDGLTDDGVLLEHLHYGQLVQWRLQPQILSENAECSGRIPVLGLVLLSRCKRSAPSQGTVVPAIPPGFSRSLLFQSSLLSILLNLKSESDQTCTIFSWFTCSFVCVHIYMTMMVYLAVAMIDRSSCRCPAMWLSICSLSHSTRSRKPRHCWLRSKVWKVEELLTSSPPLSLSVPPCSWTSLPPPPPP